MAPARGFREFSLERKVMVINFVTSDLAVARSLAKMIVEQTWFRVAESDDCRQGLFQGSFSFEGEAKNIAVEAEFIGGKGRAVVAIHHDEGRDGATKAIFAEIVSAVVGEDASFDASLIGGRELNQRMARAEGELKKLQFDGRSLPFMWIRETDFERNVYRIGIHFE